METRQHTPLPIEEQLERLALSRANDIAKLVLFSENISDRALSRLDLSLLQEIKRDRDGAVSAKIFDRYRFYELLVSIRAPESGGDAERLYSAIEQAAEALETEALGTGAPQT